MTTPVAGKRSYRGCARCKRRRQKCDEKKPSCGRCFSAEVPCEYKITLKWNGREPRKGKPPGQESKSVCKFDSQTTLPTDGEKITTVTTRTPKRRHGLEMSSLSPDFQRPAPGLSKTSRLLLHHFITETSKISSSVHIRDQICQTILPMAHQSESLLYATMAFAALHRYTLLNELPVGFIPEELVANLVASSMRCLRRDLEKSDYPVQPLLHTIRTLCHCEIFSGRASSSWRVHVNGAGAMFTEITSKRNFNESEYSFWLWSRWFWSIQALTATTDFGELSELARSESLIQEGDQSYFFDTYTGYSSDLNIALIEIGSLMHMKQAMNADTETNEYMDVLDQKTQHLEALIKHMIHRDLEYGLRFPDDIVLDPEIMIQFKACNTAYQYSSLIHLYRRVRGLPSSSPEVQGCVRAILDAVSAITPITTLSPWIVLTTPIFTAGSEAIGPDRKLVKELLQDLYFTLHIRNIIRALEILERRWEEFDNAMSSSHKVTSFESSMSVFTGMDELDSADWIDFIPY